MRSMRSEAGLLTKRQTWALAALPVSAVLLSLPMLAIRPSPLILAFAIIAWAMLTWSLRLLVAWRGYPYFAAMLTTLTSGYLGLLLGLAQDLGAAGLLVLGSWCSTRTESGVDEVWAMLRLTPLAHLGMLVGCNVGMLLIGCSDLGGVRHRMSRRLFLLWCNLGMILGMLASQFWQMPSSMLGPQAAVLLMTAQMLLGMGAGMVATWLLADRLPSPKAPVLAALGEGRD